MHFRKIHIFVNFSTFSWTTPHCHKPHHTRPVRVSLMAVPREGSRTSLTPPPRSPSWWFTGPWSGPGSPARSMLIAHLFQTASPRAESAKSPLRHRRDQSTLSRLFNMVRTTLLLPGNTSSHSVPLSLSLSRPLCLRTLNLKSFLLCVFVLMQQWSEQRKGVSRELRDPFFPNCWLS